MAAPVIVEVTDREARAALDRLMGTLQRPAPWLRKIGGALQSQIRDTFQAGVDPWGRRWVPNTRATIEAYLRRKSRGKKGYFRKDGRVAKKGIDALVAKRPLFGLGLTLSGPSIVYQVAGDGVAVGSSAVYAAMQNWGGKKAEFPNLWGDIPARPFIPVSASGELAPGARRTVLDIVEEALGGGFR